MVQGNPGSVNPALQQIQARSQQTTVTTHSTSCVPTFVPFFPYYCYKAFLLCLQDIKSEVNMGASQRSLPVDSSIYAQGMMQPKPVIGNSGMIRWS